VNRADFASKNEFLYQSACFRRHREGAPRPEYSVIPGSVHFNDTALLGKLKSSENELEFAIITLRESTIRVFVDESGPRLRDRFIPYQSLDGFPIQIKSV
jgi:hypothetical protein